MGWKEFVDQEKKQIYFNNIKKVLTEDGEYFPEKRNIFRAFQISPMEALKVIIIGQDPYVGENQANGLAFAVNGGITSPPSLRNIFKEIEYEYGQSPKSTELLGWANQGVFLLNTVLTVKRGQPLSHKDIGWETFTDKTIEFLGQLEKPLLFMLWGAKAFRKEDFIKNPKHCIIKCSHPSPFSFYNGFYKSDCFKRANEFLKNNNIPEINWIES